MCDKPFSSLIKFAKAKRESDEEARSSLSPGRRAPLNISITRSEPVLLMNFMPSPLRERAEKSTFPAPYSFLRPMAVLGASITQLRHTARFVYVSLKKARPVLFLLRNGAGNGQRSYYLKKRGRCRRGLCLLDTSTLGLPAGCALQLRQLPLVGGPLACRSLFSWPTREESLLPLPIAIDIGIGIVLFEPSGAVHLAIDEQGVRWRSRSRFRCSRHAYPRTGPSAPPASHRFFPLPYYPLSVTYYLLPILLLISRSHTAEATMRLRSSSRTILGWWPAHSASSSWHQTMTIRRSPTAPL